jgi:hypothetical protein
MSATDPEFRPGPGVTLDEIDKTLDRIAAKSSFSSNELRAKVGTKYAGSIQTDGFDLVSCWQLLRYLQ